MPAPDPTDEVYLVSAAAGHGAEIYFDRDTAIEHARDRHGVVATLPVLADFRKGEETQ
jgi:hypothetical protein